MMNTWWIEYQNRSCDFVNLLLVPAVSCMCLQVRHPDSALRPSRPLHRSPLLHLPDTPFSILKRLTTKLELSTHETDLKTAWGQSPRRRAAPARAPRGVPLTVCVSTCSRGRRWQSTDVGGRCWSPESPAAQSTPEEEPDRTRFIN